MRNEPWEILGSETVLSHPFLTVSIETVRLPDGMVINNWPIVDARDYVMVVAENTAGELLLLDVYRHGLRRLTWQIVGGYIEQGENPLDAAKRELQEEAGYTSNDWSALGSFVVDPNRYIGTGHLFLARHAVSTHKLPSDDLEQATPRWLALEEARRALAGGRVNLMSSALALSLAFAIIAAEGAT